jgi:hypothetical protein
LAGVRANVDGHITFGQVVDEKLHLEGVVSRVATRRLDVPQSDWSRAGDEAKRVAYDAIGLAASPINKVLEGKNELMAKSGHWLVHFAFLRARPRSARRLAHVRHMPTATSGDVDL